MNIRKLATLGHKGTETSKTYGGSVLPTLQREIDRLFEDFFSRDIGFPLAARAWPGENALLPEVDVDETDGEIHVTAELPGIDEKDVDVSFAEGVLTVKGEKKAESETKEKQFHRVERSFGRFERRIAIPVNVDESKIDATFTKGVLEITLPKTEVEEEAVTHIEVKAA